MRFATLTAKVDEQAIETTVTKLSFEGDWENAVKDNVNRWRKQVSLTDSQEPLAGAQELKTESDVAIAFVDLLGEVSEKGSSMTMPPFAGHPPMDPRQGAASQAAPPASASPLEFKKPDSWREGKKSAMRLAAFEAGEPDKSVEITLIPASGDEEGNVRRWLGQIRAEVPEETVQAALSDASEVKVGTLPGKMYRLQGDKDQAIYAIIAPQPDGNSLFLKMTGNVDTAEAQAENLVAFAASIEFK
jgi:hypothetical protein